MAAPKYDKLFYSIGEVVKRYNIPVSTLHYWEKEFSELKPHRNKKGNRMYTEDDILLLDTIYFLVKEKGYTIKGAKERLKTDRITQEKNAKIRNSLLNIRALMLEMKESLDEAIKKKDIK
jgi:DNA-binding transcriptional MerR regulator